MSISVFQFPMTHSLCYTSFWKWVLKKVAKRMDAERIRNSALNHILSLEYLMEWYLSVVYVSWFRINIVYNVPPLELFVVLFLVHIGSEVAVSCTRFSRWYFELTTRIMACLSAKAKRGHSFYKYLSRILEDDSDLNEWRNRNALDMTLRLYSSLLVGIIQLYLLLVISSTGFSEAYQLDTYGRGIRYGSFLTAAELLYFAVLWAHQWRTKQYDIFSPFTLYVSGMPPGQRVLTMLTFFSAIVPSMLQ